VGNQACKLVVCYYSHYANVVNVTWKWVNVVNGEPKLNGGRGRQWCADDDDDVIGVLVNVPTVMCGVVGFSNWHVNRQYDVVDLGGER